MDLKDKVVLVSGGGSGLGAQTAKTLAQNGMRVAIFDRSLDNIGELIQTFDILAFNGDVQDEVAVQFAIQEIIAKWGAIHVNLNCAGVADAGRIVGKEGPFSMATFQKVIGINLIGTFNVMRLVANQMAKQTPINEDSEGGVIINTASVAAFEGQIGQAAYSASKGGVAAMTLPAARELAKFGIRVVTIAPGIMSTPMVAHMPEKVQESLKHSIPFPSRLGKSEEYADLLKHIIENRYLNGTTIRLDAAVRMTSQ